MWASSLWGQQGEPAYTQLSGGASVNLDSNNFDVCRADMDPNNVGIVRFARAGKFFFKNLTSPNSTSGIAVGRIALDYRSSLFSDKVLSKSSRGLYYFQKLSFL